MVDPYIVPIAMLSTFLVAYPSSWVPSSPPPKRKNRLIDTSRRGSPGCHRHIRALSTSVATATTTNCATMAQYPAPESASSTAVPTPIAFASTSVVDSAVKRRLRMSSARN